MDFKTIKTVRFNLKHEFADIMNDTSGSSTGIFVINSKNIATSKYKQFFNSQCASRFLGTTNKLQGAI